MVAAATTPPVGHPSSPEEGNSVTWPCPYLVVVVGVEVVAVFAACVVVEDGGQFFGGIGPGLGFFLCGRGVVSAVAEEEGGVI